MYLGSAAAMLVLPGLVARAGPGALLKLVGALGYAWLLLWLAVGREVPHRLAVIMHLLLPCALHGKKLGRRKTNVWVVPMCPS